MASETEIECAILAADGTYNAMGLHAQELGRIIRELEAERDELRQTVDRLDDALRLASREKDEWGANYEALANTTPRTITAEELRERQIVAAFVDGEYTSHPAMVAGRISHIERHPGLLVGQPDDIQFTVEREGYDPDTWSASTFLHVVLLADAPPQEPEPEPARRGRVVKPEELREGDVVDRHYKQVSYIDQKVQRACPDYVDFPTARIDIPDTLGGLELRLISRKPPEPEEHPIILVHRALKAYDEPVPAYQLSGNAWATPDREKVFYADSIQDWSSARVVPAGQEV